MISIESDTSSDDPDLGVEEDIRRGGLTETEEVHYKKRSTKRMRSCATPTMTTKKLKREGSFKTSATHDNVPSNGSIKKPRKEKRPRVGKSAYDSVSVSPRDQDNQDTTKTEITPSSSSTKLKTYKRTTPPQPTKANTVGSARTSRSAKLSSSAKPTNSAPSLMPTSHSSPTLPKTKSKKTTKTSKTIITKTTPRTTTTTSSTSTTPKTTTSTSSTTSETTSTHPPQATIPPAQASPSWWHSGEFTKEDEEFLHTEVELARDICNKKGESVVSDATDLMHHLASAYSTTTQSFVKPNVLVTGITGAGKSTLINSLFGKKLAQTGTGVPITQHFTKYDSPDTRAIVYDSKGLGHGHYEEFIDTTKAFFKSREVNTIPKKNRTKNKNDAHTDIDAINDTSNNNDGGPIHVVWYIVNTAHARFEQFEQELCQRLFAPFPIFFLLNKADLSSQADRDNLRKVITSMSLPNCCGIIDIIAEPEKKLKRGCDTCPHCESDDVQCRVKSGLLICNDCGHRESLVQEHGLDKVIRATLMILPALVKDNFVAAQNVILTLKDEMSRTVLAEFWEDFTSSTATTTTSLLNTIARMLCRLSNVWEFDGHGDEVGQLLATHLVSALKWKKQKVKKRKEKSDLCTSNRHRGRGSKGGRGRGSSGGRSRDGGCEVVLSDAQRVHVVSLGILWNFCLRELAQQLVHEWERGLEEERRDECTQTCSLLYQKVFSALKEENLKLIENSLIEKSVLENVKAGGGSSGVDEDGGESGAGYNGGCRSVKDVICSFDFLSPCSLLAAK